MNSYKRIEYLVQQILKEKEKIDLAHIKKAAALGCACRRCKTVRGIKNGH